MDDYSRGDYASAEARFNELETDVPDMNPKGYVRYKIYRGLTKLELGDKAQGCALLREGKSALDRGESRWLPDNIHQRVSEAMVSCGAQ